MDEITDATKVRFQRVELLTGPGRRRRWSAAEKAQIVAETLVAGVRVSDVARRWQLHPQQLFGWRYQAREEAALAGRGQASEAGQSFVPIAMERGTSTAAVDVASSQSSIEIELAGAVVRVTCGVADEFLTAVLRAVRSSSSEQ